MTRERRNRSWLLGTLDPSRIQPGRGATESVRGRSPAWPAVENAVAKQPCSRGALLVSSRGGRWSIRPKLEARRQSCVHLRLGHRKTWLGAVAEFRLRLELRAVGAAHAVRSGTRTVLGCSFRKSVAEVGKKHLPSRTRGEPRGEPKLRPGSTYRRRSPDKKRHPGTGERVRARRANLTVNANRLTRLQDRGSNRRKASWVSVFAVL